MQCESRLAKSQRREQILSMLPLIILKQNVDGHLVAGEDTSQMLNSFSMGVKIECEACGKGRRNIYWVGNKTLLRLFTQDHNIICLSLGCMKEEKLIAFQFVASWMLAMEMNSLVESFFIKKSSLV